MSVDDFCRTTRRLRNEVPIPAKNRVAIGVIRPRAVKIDRLVDPRLLVGTGVRHRRSICLLLHRYERIQIPFRSKPYRKTPRLPTIRATVDSAAPTRPCKDNSAAHGPDPPHLGRRSPPLPIPPPQPTNQATVAFTAQANTAKN